jgi:hypothetical protein
LLLPHPSLLLPTSTLPTLPRERHIYVHRQRLPQVRQHTKTVMGSSELRVCRE